MSPTRQLLESQRDRLKAAIAGSQHDRLAFYDRNRAQDYLSRVNWALLGTDAQIEAARGFYGENGWAPGIDDACRSLDRERFVEVERLGAGRIAA